MRWSGNINRARFILQNKSSFFIRQKTLLLRRFAGEFYFIPLPLPKGKEEESFLISFFFFFLQTGYQITQQRRPLAFNGEIKFHVYGKGFDNKPYKKVSKIKQLQLEQDSGKSLHDAVARRFFFSVFSSLKKFFFCKDN